VLSNGGSCYPKAEEDNLRGGKLLYLEIRSFAAGWDTLLRGYPAPQGRPLQTISTLPTGSICPLPHNTLTNTRNFKIVNDAEVEIASEPVALC
jgi:hypothetical protein